VKRVALFVPQRRAVPPSIGSQVKEEGHSALIRPPQTALFRSRAGLSGKIRLPSFAKPD